MTILGKGKNLKKIFFFGGQTTNRGEKQEDTNRTRTRQEQTLTMNNKINHQMTLRFLHTEQQVPQTYALAFAKSQLFAGRFISVSPINNSVTALDSDH